MNEYDFDEEDIDENCEINVMPISPYQSICNSRAYLNYVY